MGKNIDTTDNTKIAIGICTNPIIPIMRAAFVLCVAFLVVAIIMPATDMGMVKNTPKI